MGTKAFVFCLIFTAFFSACDYSKMTNMGGTGDDIRNFNLPAEEQAQLSFAYVYQQVLYPKCTSCHGSSGHVNLETYQQTLPNLAKIKNTVFMKGSMPKDTLLTQDQKAILWNWIQRGAPEVGQVPPPPPPEPVQPTYDSINQHIFQRQCVSCHSEGHKAAKVPLDRDSLLKPDSDVVIPGNPDKSELVIAVERTDKKRMPPAKAGYKELSADEKAAIREWIQNGAQD